MLRKERKVPFSDKQGSRSREQLLDQHHLPLRGLLGTCSHGTHLRRHLISGLTLKKQKHVEPVNYSLTS